MADPVRIVFGNDEEGIQAQGDSSGNLYTTTGVISGGYKTYEDDNFVTGDSPATHDFSTDKGRNAQRGYIICDGAGNIQVDISNDGVAYHDKFTMKSGETVSLDGLDINKIRITWVTNSAYRIFLI